MIRRVLSLVFLLSIPLPAVARTSSAVSSNATAVRTPPGKVVYIDGFNGAFDTAIWHSGYYRYDTPIDQSRAVANGEHSRYAPEMATIARSALHLGMEPDRGGSRLSYDLAIRDARTRANAELASRIENGASASAIAQARTTAGYYTGESLRRMTDVAWRSGLVASNAPLVRNGQMVTFTVSGAPTGGGVWPALWLFDPVRQMELDVMEGNGQRQIVGHRHVDGLPSGATTTIAAPVRAYRVSLWIDGKTLRWYVNGKPWYSMASGVGIGGEYHIYMNYAMASPTWAWVGVDDKTTPQSSEFAVGTVTVTAP